MTTIIVVAIVALVFFVTICVVTFMAWKRESEMRTDSIKAIERTMNDMAYELSELNVDKKRYAAYNNSQHDIESVVENIRQVTKKSKGCGSASAVKKKDPFSWTRHNKTNGATEDDTVTVFKPMEGESRNLKWTEVSAVNNAEEEKPANIPVVEEEPPVQETEQAESTEETNNTHSNSISLSFVELGELDNWEEIEFFESLSGIHTDYDKGRSGRKYTAEELEELIKE